MKRLIPGILAAAAVMSLAACSDNNNSDSTPAASSFFQTVLDQIRNRTSDIGLPQMINDLLATDDDTNESATPVPVPTT